MKIGEDERGVAKEEEVKVEEEEVVMVLTRKNRGAIRATRNTREKVMVVVVVVEADALVWISARQRGRSSTLEDARPARTSDRDESGKRQREREQVTNTSSHQRR